MNHAMPQTTIFGLHLCRRLYGSIAAVSLTYSSLRKLTALGQMTQNNGHYAVQGHSRSPLSVPIESPYANSYISE